MIGSRPLTETEVKLILTELGNLRDQCMFTIGLKTGFRIGEILSLTVGDVTQYGKIRDSITVSRSNMKGKTRSRSVVLHNDAKEALRLYLESTKIESELFPVCKRHASRIIKEAVLRARVEGKVTTHSARKTFAKKIYEALGRDLIGTQKAMGHVSINSTTSYLSFDQDNINNAIRGI